MTSTSHNRGVDALVLFTASVLSCIVWRGAQQPNKNKTSSKEVSIDPLAADKYYLERAHDYRLKLTAPQQSNFRVVAILLLEDGNLIYGTNDEPSPNISLAMCAERCAFLRYRAQETSSPVKTVYIVTDSDTQVAPGTACREFMYGHPATTPETRIVLQSRDRQSEFSSYTLSELIPYPSIFAGMPPEEQLEWGKKHQSIARQQLATISIPGLPQSTAQKLIEAARNATDLDTRESVHAIRYGASIAISVEGNVEILQASQVKALEYSSTQDAVCQMSFQVLKKVHGNSSAKVLAVVQVDQFGIPHGLFAPARAFFVEHGFGDCNVILTSLEDGVPKVRTVAAKRLSPLVPEFRS